MDYHWRAEEQPLSRTTETGTAATVVPLVAVPQAKKPKWIPVSLSGKGVRVDVVERTDGRFVDEWGQVWGGIPGVG